MYVRRHNKRSAAIKKTQNNVNSEHEQNVGKVIIFNRLFFSGKFFGAATQKKNNCAILPSTLVLSPSTTL